MGIWHNVRSGTEQGGGPALASCIVTLADGSQADIATSILHEAGGLRIQGAGRQTELQPSEPGNATIAVDNAAGDHTPGRFESVAPLNLGTQVRYRETVGRKTFELFTGALEQPTVTLGMLPNGAGDVVQATAIDWIGQQGNTRRYISNLSEWVLYHGGDALVGYWPMTESTKPFLPAVDTGNAPAVSYDIFGSSDPPVAGDVAITAASTDMPLGEDASIPTIGGALTSAGVPAYAYHMGVEYTGPTSVPPNIGVGEVFTFVAWVRPTAFPASSEEIFHVIVVEQPSSLASDLTIYKDPVTGRLAMDAGFGDLTGIVDASGMKTDHTYPVAIRWGASPKVFEVWIERTRYIGSLTGSGPTGGYVDAIHSGGASRQGGFGQLQIYAGAPADYTFEDYLAQIDHVTNALTGGLRWQRTDERLRQLLRYAGLNDAQMDLDVGAAYMPRASLARTTLTDQISRVVATEQGRVFAAGDGNVRFHNRVRTRYNF